MTVWSEKTWYGGKRVNQGTAQIFRAANRMLATNEFGAERGDFTIYQGSYNGGGVSASAGTHDGGGAADISPYNWQNRIKVFRMLGVAIWRRPYVKNLWAEHLHMIVCGDGTASYGAKQQVLEYYAGQDGLAGSGRDTHWRPKDLPVLFVLDADLRDRYCWIEAQLYDQPSQHGATRGEPVKVGAKIGNIVATVVADGRRWFVTADGRCGSEGSFASTPPKPVKPIALVNRAGLYRVHVNEFTWGWDQPGDLGTKKLVRAYGDQLLSTDAYTVLDNGQTWVRSRTVWYNAAYLRGTERPDGPGDPRLANKRLALINVRAKRIGSFNGHTNYRDRIGGLAKVIQASGSSIVATTESGTYADGNALSDALGKDWRNVLHGDDGVLTNAIQWDNKQNELVAEGKVQTTGPHHDWATWAVLRDRETRVPFLVAVTQTDERAFGLPKRGSEWDQLRERQVESMVKQVEKIAAQYTSKLRVGKVQVVYAGGFSQDKDDPYDGPGRAMRLRRYVDAEVTAKRRYDGDRETVNDFSRSFDVGRRPDRFFVPAEMPVLRQATLLGHPASDHNLVMTSVDVSDFGRL